MNSEVTPDVELAVFAQAIRLPKHERDDYLQRECAGKTEIRHRVRALLDAHEDPDSFLAGIADGQLPVTEEGVRSSDISINQAIGNYKLLQELGEGGLGTVYMAEQLRPVKRRVAVKIVKQGMDTRQFVARFEAERQALAMMDHPNIARVLDAGCTENGRPYFVMELVKGGST